MNFLAIQKNHNNTYKNSGFTIIEVLISLLILSFGVIGTLKMQMDAVKMSQQTTHFNTAITLASEMADKIRSNQGYSSHDKSNPYLQVNFQSGKNEIELSDTCYLSTCNAKQLAQTDIAEWTQQIDSTLPNARAVICQDSSSFNRQTNQLSWECAPKNTNASVVIKLGWSNQHDDDPDPPPRLAMAITPYVN